MKLNPEIRMRSLGKHHIIVDANSERLNFTNVYELNETAAWLWDAASKGDFSAESLAGMLCEEYQVEYPKALADVERILRKWSASGFIIS